MLSHRRCVSLLFVYPSPDRIAIKISKLKAFENYIRRRLFFSYINPYIVFAPRFVNLSEIYKCKLHIWTITYRN